MKNVIGNILQELLSEKGSPTKKDFSEMLGISVKTLYNVVDGSSELTINQITKASDILNFDILNEYNKRIGKEYSSDSKMSVAKKIPTNQQATLTFNFGILPEAYDNIAAFMIDINALALKHGIKVL
ncbi:helix-turn-helix domain-containing protein [Pedobacter sp. Hv1]|uniref:helix-turn-helix domain-containing protein n=1 Tax=Pedobacter sp. Hv1 TaxID=1740090 RepID=UPI0006D89000|nr:helix-turn-helix domain-containing protein [Pedobacter sp. Hv1]KQC02057.1 hypothetical protein AQF98_00345 [Pedobacter sp. Hv1]